MAFVASLAACTGPQLVPLHPSEDGAAHVEREGLSISARAADGSRPRDLPVSVTPVHVRVANDGLVGVHVALADIELRVGSRVFAARVPSSLEPRAPVSTLGVDPGSPFAYSGISGVDGRGASGAYFQQGGSAPPWTRSAQVPELVRAAFPTGFVEPGQAREGFVYFDPLPGDAGEVTLRVGLRIGQSSGSHWTAELPFLVKG